MNFVLDASVTMCWLLADGKPSANAYAGKVLEAAVKEDTQAVVSMTWGLEVSLSDTLQLARRHRLSAYDASYLEVALREGLPLATLDDDLRKTARKAGVQAFGL